MQSFPTKYKSSFQCFSSTLKQEGMRGLYQGASPAVFGQMCKTAIVFMSYSLCIDLVKTTTGKKWSWLLFNNLNEMVCNIFYRVFRAAGAQFVASGSVWWLNRSRRLVRRVSAWTGQMSTASSKHLQRRASVKDTKTTLFSYVDSFYNGTVPFNCSNVQYIHPLNLLSPFLMRVIKKKKLVDTIFISPLISRNKPLCFWAIRTICYLTFSFCCVLRLAPWHIGAEAVRADGIRGLYRGLPGIWTKEIPGSFIYFGSFELAKTFMKSLNEDSPLSKLLWCKISSVTKIIKARVFICN